MRRLTSAITGLAFVAVGVLAAIYGKQLREKGAEVSPSAAKPQAVVQQIVSSGDGNRFVAETLETIERSINIVAKVRQRVHLGSSELTGTGQYWQQGAGNQRRTRWSLQTLVSGEQGSLLQVFDSQHLWTDLHLPSKHEVTKIDLHELRRLLAAKAANNRQAPNTQGRGPSDARVARPTQQLLLAHRGGLTQLLDELVQRFDFDEPRPMWWEDRSVFALIGHWKPDQVEKLWPNYKPGDEWPEALPHHVLLMVGQTNLFPYLIEYRRGADAALSQGEVVFEPADEPLTRYELFDVQFAQAIDHKLDLFKYADAEHIAVDITGEVFHRLSPNKEEPEVEAPIQSVSSRKNTFRR
ncbi:hypothetical protein [Adhaeretor mobilis]|uniref:Uncharacterized protein n=1 Tax=Adhaeretor mobilis TaxID=1930276 RepID=A0A517N0D1_9BACT|nr:hypothetical protein [Adhaeretor mobilis]QDT00564.1 hypothetical protein HG15A2_39020 [Adhaeretor mobilis]